MTRSHEFALFANLLSALLMACSPGTLASPSSTAVPVAADVAPTGTPGLPAAASAKIKLYFRSAAQVELFSPEGSRVLIDIATPARLSSQPTSQDILLTTHTHSDHYNSDFQRAFPGQQLFTKVGAIEQPFFKVQGIAAGHNPADAFKPENGTDYLYVVEMGNLRIAHMGDCGQEALTDEQLAALGKVDIAFAQFDNSFSGMDTTNRNGFTLMDQLKPRLIIPTHSSMTAAQIIGTLWPTLYSDKEVISVSRADLLDETHVLFLGGTARTNANMTNAAKVDW